MKSKIDLMIKGLDMRCPWQSIHFITHKVDNVLRYDAILSNKELLDLDLVYVTNQIKLNWFKVYKKYGELAYVQNAIDLTKINYDNWEINLISTFKHDGKTIRPWEEGFAIALKEVEIDGKPIDLNAVSIAVFVYAK